MEETIEETSRGLEMRLCLNLRNGLHARPAARLAQEAQRYVERQHELYASGSGKMLREEMLARKALNAEGGIDPVDQAMMQALVKKMPKRLADRYSRRRNRARKGHMDIRRTLRTPPSRSGRWGMWPVRGMRFSVALKPATPQ